ncbi:hypothetical protein BHM03_00035053 [Ensete ventricosum]|nr:hypothetical protein BHM03_00035053 [Ensete ventricosum]
MDTRGFFVGTQGMLKLLGMSTGRSGTQMVDCEPFDSSKALENLFETMSLSRARKLLRTWAESPIKGEVYLDQTSMGEKSIRGSRSEDLVWLAFVGGVSLFASASFRSLADSPVVDTCTKVVVRGARCYPDSTPMTVKSAR